MTARAWLVLVYAVLLVLAWVWFAVVAANRISDAPDGCSPYSAFVNACAVPYQGGTDE